ncbi:TRAP transporter small permease subunit [Cloacibacillus sp. An23]|uniref:TRAP transporter small permease n=1 Tax=Cloacibacillus sp. An23 TaxID=1965591 RepID=UPI000B36F95A|nr:TRAP transporter small permease subunit [Cloacibacillus sp. An23]OUO93529.1 hypothetical protein B5F39_07485 [Cloacibacillus sp. An23]
MFLKKQRNFLVTFEEAILVILGLAVPLMVALGVFFRYILKTDLFGIEEIEIFCAMILYFIGAAYASYKKQQITADLTQSMIKSFKIRKFFAIVSTFLALVAVGAFTYWTIDLVQYAGLRNPKTSVWKIPLVWEYIMIFWGFFVMTLCAARDFYNALTRKPEASVDSEK